MQGDIEVWHKNFLTDEGTGINIYETLKHLNELVHKDRHNIIEYYQNLVAKNIEGEHESYEVI